MIERTGHGRGWSAKLRNQVVVKWCPPLSLLNVDTWQDKAPFMFLTLPSGVPACSLPKSPASGQPERPRSVPWRRPSLQEIELTKMWISSVKRNPALSGGLYQTAERWSWLSWHFNIYICFNISRYIVFMYIIYVPQTLHGTGVINYTSQWPLKPPQCRQI